MNPLSYKSARGATIGNHVDRYLRHHPRRLPAEGPGWLRRRNKERNSAMRDKWRIRRYRKPRKRDFVPIYLSRVPAWSSTKKDMGCGGRRPCSQFVMNTEIEVHVADVKGLFWAEADYIEDVNRIERWFATGDIRRTGSERNAGACEPRLNVHG